MLLRPIPAFERATERGLYRSIITVLLSIDFAKLKGRTTVGRSFPTSPLATSIGIPKKSTRYQGVTKVFIKYITAVVATTAVYIPTIDDLKDLRLEYISDAVSEKVADEAKFITKPNQPVSEPIVRNSINAETSEITTAENGP